MPQLDSGSYHEGASPVNKAGTGRMKYYDSTTLVRLRIGKESPNPYDTVLGEHYLNNSIASLIILLEKLRVIR